MLQSKVKPSMQNEEPPKDAREGGEKKGFPRLFRHIPCQFPPGGGARSGSPPRLSYIPLPSAARARRAAGEAPPAAPARRTPPPRPPGWFFPAAEVGPGAGVRGESAPAARNGQVAATLVRLGVISGAEVSAGEQAEKARASGWGAGGGSGAPPHPRAGD